MHFRCAWAQCIIRFDINCSTWTLIGVVRCGVSSTHVRCTGTAGKARCVDRRFAARASYRNGNISTNTAHLKAHGIALSVAQQTSHKSQLSAQLRCSARSVHRFVHSAAPFMAWCAWLCVKDLCAWVSAWLPAWRSTRLRRQQHGTKISSSTRNQDVSARVQCRPHTARCPRSSGDHALP